MAGCENLETLRIANRHWTWILINGIVFAPLISVATYPGGSAWLRGQRLACASSCSKSSSQDADERCARGCLSYGDGSLTKFRLPSHRAAGHSHHNSSTSRCGPCPVLFIASADRLCGRRRGLCQRHRPRVHLANKALGCSDCAVLLSRAACHQRGSKAVVDLEASFCE